MSASRSNRVKNGASSPTLTSDPSSWSVGTNTFAPTSSIALTSAHQLSPDGINLVLSTASNIRTTLSKNDDDEEKTKLTKCLNHKILSVVSYTPNPSSDASHLEAFAALGGGTLHVDASKKGKANMTSAKKGETLADTLSCMECYGDVAVLRHWDEEAVEEAVKRSGKGLILGGGVSHDVTAALGDLMAIVKSGEGTERKQTIVVSILGNCRDGISPVSELIILLGRYMASIGCNVLIRDYSPAGNGLSGEAMDFITSSSNMTLGDVDISADQYQEKPADIVYRCGAVDEAVESKIKALPLPKFFVFHGDGGGEDGMQAKCRLDARMAVYKLMLASGM